MLGGGVERSEVYKLKRMGDRTSLRYTSFELLGFEFGMLVLCVTFASFDVVCDEFSYCG